MGVYSLSKVKNESSGNKIERILFDKYGIIRNESKPKRPMIVDAQENSILISNELFYSITYLSGDMVLLDSFHKEIQNVISQKKSMQAPLDRHLRRNL